MRIIGISCINYNRAIGKNNKLLYNIKSDLDFFKKITILTENPGKYNAVIMGSKTYLSIPEKFRPLKKRINIVISKNNYEIIKDKDNCVFSSIDDGIHFIYSNPKIENLYVIGGQSIYNYFYEKNLYNEILINEVQSPKNDIGDAFFPEINKEQYMKFSDGVVIDNGYKYEKLKYLNTFPSFLNIRDTCEQNYLSCIEDVLVSGEKRQTRNSETISKFGVTMKFDISQKFPLLTTKKVYWKGVVEELMWFLKGNTNSKLLEKKKVKIWSGNSSDEFIKKNNLNYKEGDCGPIYGFQWRNFNAEYLNCESDYNGKGIDQLKNCIDLIKNDPFSRRIFMSAWNPCQLDEMVLPPCHVSYQFYVSSDGKLNCQMYQRSGDLFLGIPFNIASTALLTNIIAKMTDYQPGFISVVVGDAHIYKSHLEQVCEQLNRKPYPLPKIEILKKHENIEEYCFEDFKLKYYNYHPSIKADMIV